jgi:hypothetical protein
MKDYFYRTVLIRKSTIHKTTLFKNYLKKKLTGIDSFWSTDSEGKIPQQCGVYFNPGYKSSEKVGNFCKVTDYFCTQFNSLCKNTSDFT